MPKKKKFNLVGLLAVYVVAWLLLQNITANYRHSVITSVQQYVEANKVLPTTIDEVAETNSETEKLMSAIRGFWPEIQCEALSDHEVRIKQTFSKFVIVHWTFVDEVPLMTHDGTVVRLKGLGAP
jgi:hypothetical protein